MMYTTCRMRLGSPIRSGTGCGGWFSRGGNIASAIFGTRMLAATTADSRGSSASVGSGTTDSVPKYWCALNPSASGASALSGRFAIPLIFAAMMAPLPERTCYTRDAAGQQQQSGGLRNRLKLAANLSTRKLHSVNIEVRLTVEQSGDEGRLSARHCSAICRDECRVVRRREC